MKLSNRWTRIVLIVTIVEIAAFFYLDYRYYAGVIRMGMFGSILFFQMGMAYEVIKKGNKRASYMVIAIPLLAAVLFAISLPTYTLQDAKRIVAEQEAEVEIVELVSGENTVPVSSSSSWWLSNRFYYVSVKDQDGGLRYFVVDPANGRVHTLEKPYW